MPNAIQHEPVASRVQRRFERSSDISEPGLELRVSWLPVAGATDVEVTDATLRFDAALAEETFPDVPVLREGSHRVVPVPAGRSTKSLGLDVPLLAGQRLTVSLPSLGGGWEAPLFASTGVSNGAMAPASPQGATLANGVFVLPRAVSASKLRLSVVTGDKMTDFNPVPFDLPKVNLTATTPPRNIRVLGPDRTPIWQAPELPEGSPIVEVDLRTPLEIAFRKRIGANAAPDAAVTIAGEPPSRAFVSPPSVRGALIRQAEGITSVTLAGAPRAIPFVSPLALERPTSVVGDLAVRYDGLRILETASDAIPANLASAAGVIVGAENALCILPPEGLNGLAPARIGVPGRAPEDCEIAFEFVRVVGSAAGPPVGPPAVLTLSASRAIDMHWVDVPGGLNLEGPVGLLARANRGRFFWVAAENRPMVRLAIRDSNPGGRLLSIGSSHRLAITTAIHQQAAYAFPAEAFASRFPVLTSDLFLTVEISDLTLRYAR